MEDQILILIVKYLVIVQGILLIQEVPIRLETELAMFTGRLKDKECVNGSVMQSLDVFSVALEGVVKHVVIAEVRQRKRTKNETNLDSVFQ